MQEITNLWNRRSYAGNQTRDILLHMPRAQMRHKCTTTNHCFMKWISSFVYCWFIMTMGLCRRIFLHVNIADKMQIKNDLIQMRQDRIQGTIRTKDSIWTEEKRKRSDSALWQKPLHRQKNPKSNVTTHRTLPKTSITQRLRTDLGRSAGVTIATQLVWLNRFTGSQPSH